MEIELQFSFDIPLIIVTICKFPFIREHYIVILDWGPLTPVWPQLNYICSNTIFNYGHILQFWELRFQYMILIGYTLAINIFSLILKKKLFSHLQNSPLQHQLLSPKFYLNIILVRYGLDFSYNSYWQKNSSLWDYETRQCNICFQNIRVTQV